MMMFDTRVPVVVATHLGGNGYLGIARTLGRVGVPVYLGNDPEVGAARGAR